MFERYTENAKRAIYFSKEEAIKRVLTRQATSSSK